MIISIETYCLMARCLKKECTPEEQEALADLLSANSDLRQEYELFRSYFYYNEKRHPQDTESSLQKKFERVTRKLKEEGSLSLRTSW